MHGVARCGCMISRSSDRRPSRIRARRTDHQVPVLLTSPAPSVMPDQVQPEADDFALKFRLALEALNWSRTRCAQEMGVHKSVVSRWASGDTIPSEHNLTRLTAMLRSVSPRFHAGAWRLGQ